MFTDICNRLLCINVLAASSLFVPSHHEENISGFSNCNKSCSCLNLTSKMRYSNNIKSPIMLTHHPMFQLWVISYHSARVDPGPFGWFKGYCWWFSQRRTVLCFQNTSTSLVLKKCITHPKRCQNWAVLTIYVDNILFVPMISLTST